MSDVRGPLQDDGAGRAVAATRPIVAPVTGTCPWAISSPALLAYHDREWGRPVRGDARVFERIVLEGAQAGLSWAIILAKRPAYRRAFADFDPDRVAAFTARDERRLLADAGIVRNRAKIRSAIGNARAYLALKTEVGSIARYLTGFDDPVALSKDLKRRGFTFVGPTICESVLQALGVIDGHVRGCALARPRPVTARRATAASGARRARR